MTVRSLRCGSAAGRRLQRLIAWVLIACMIVLVSGVPLPTQSKEVSSEAFPCQDCPCGCHTAAQCWNHCCCYTDEEKLQWSRQHGVTPPAFLMERVAQAKRQLSGGLVAGRSNSAKRACCQSHPSIPDGPAPAEPAPEQPAADGNVRWVSIQGLHQCQGIELTLSLLSHAVVTAGRQPLLRPEPWLLFVLRLVDEGFDFFSGSIDPPVP